MQNFQIKLGFSKIYLLIIAFFIFSCKKNQDETRLDELSKIETAEKVSTWLSSLICPTKDENNQPLRNLKNYLQLNDLSIEKRNDKENLVVIPIKKDFKTEYNHDKDLLMYMVATIKEDGSISGSNIVQYISTNGERSSLPANTFARIYTYKNIEVDGRFVMLSLAGAFTFDLTFEEGKLRQVRETNKKDSKSSTQREGETCYDFYLETTHYYDDGSTYTTTEYLGRTCYPCGVIGPDGNTTQCTSIGNDDGSGSGGGAVSNVYEYASQKQVEWVVAESQNHYYYIKSVEKLYGQRTAGQTGSSYFTNMEHLGDDEVNVVSAGYANWVKLGNTVDYSSSTASSSISGKVTFSNGSPDVSVPTRTKNWFSTIEFP
jgi:hypothetical protein